jgi:hypothetical protein
MLCPDFAIAIRPPRETAGAHLVREGGGHR